MAQPDSEALLALQAANRDAVERMRETSAALNAAYAGNLAAKLTNYNMDVAEINERHFARFMAEVPTKFSVNSDKSEYPTGHIIKQAETLPAIMMFGAFLEGATGDGGYSAAAGLLVGRRINPDNQDLTELLFASRRIKDGRNRQVVYAVEVRTDDWEALGAHLANRTSAPLSQELPVSRMTDGTYAHIATAYDNTIGLTHITRKIHEGFFSSLLADDVANYKPARRAKEIRSESKPQEGRLLASRMRSREIRASDFDDFDIWGTLEFVAAAYGIGGKLDEIQEARRAELPRHPADEMFPGYSELDAAARQADGLPQ